MQWRHVRPLSYLLILLILMGGCAPPTAPSSRPVVDVGVILGKGGLGDRSFNDSAYAGLQEAQRRYGVRFTAINYTTDEANLEALRGLLRQGYALIIGIGYENAGYIETLAKEFPDRRFALIDATVALPNVASVTYREPEGDFLMGVLAAMLTRTRQVGFIGGVDMEITRRIERGFRQGVAYQDSTVIVVSDLAGTFSEPDIGKALALKQYQAGVDIIYNAAGRTGLGVIEAAKEAGKLTIGTSGDQRYLAPGNVVGNRPKRVDTAVLMLVDDVLHGAFQPGVRSLGLKEGGLALGPFDERIVPASTLRHLDELKKKIIAGEIQVESAGQ